MKRIFTTGILICLLQSTLAEPLTTPVDNLRKIYFGAGVGAVIPKASANNSIGTGAGWPNDWYGNDSIANAGSFFLAMGYQWLRSTYWFPNYSAGLRYQSVSHMTAQGYVDQYSLAGFRNYNYRYDVNFLNVLATFKADIVRWRNWMPYFLLAAGIANYNTYNYKEMATLSVTPRVSPGFGSYSGTNFLYNVGVGLDYVYHDNLWFNLEYNYSDYGRVRTGYGANTESLTDTNYSGEYLKNDITASALFLGVTYFAQ